MRPRSIARSGGSPTRLRVPAPEASFLRLTSLRQDVAEIRVAPQTPDDFLTSLLDHSTVEAAMTALQEQARFHAWTVAELLALLATAKPDRPAIVPNYVRRIAELTGGA